MGDLVLRLFIPEGGEVLQIASTINHTALWGWIFLSVSMGLFAVWMQPLLGVAAIWWSLPFGSISSAALAYAYYRWGGWRKRGLMLAKSA